MKKVQNINIRKWVFKEEKIKPNSPKPIYTCFCPKQKPFVLWQAWREITKVREQIHEGLSEGEPVSKGRGAYTRERGAHRGRDALAASPQCKINKGAAHSGRAAHWAQRATHTAKELKTLANLFYIPVEGLQARGRLE